MAEDRAPEAHGDAGRGEKDNVTREKAVEPIPPTAFSYLHINR
tara:strand:- start:434 stop:562 length:129 start_codon:yes stop_codon:yes gene_type:complete